MDFSFPSHVHHLFINDQLVLFDEKVDTYTILSEIQTHVLLTENKSCEQYSEIYSGLLSLNKIIDQQCPSLLIRKAGEKYVGVDNYTWRINRNKSSKSFNLLATVSASIDLVRLKINLFQYGLEFTLNKMRATKRTAIIKQKIANHHTYDDYVHGVHLASLVMPFKVKCLESSICIFNYFTKSGRSCNFYIGVQLFDFLSHAWVEIDGEVVADETDISKKLPKILSI